MMEATTLNSGGRIVSISFAIIFLLIFSPLQHLYAQQQMSTFTIPGWIPGTNPVFTGSDSNVISLNYGDNLTTTLAFSGSPDDGMGVDESNFAFMGFSYTYTTYLTRAGDTFSTSSSIPLGIHTISAHQACTSGNVPPWTIGYDMQPTVDTNNLHMNIADIITDCITPGNYQVDIVLNSYSQNTAGPSPSPILLQWYGYANNDTTGGLTALSAPSDNNTASQPLMPVSNYILRQVAFVHIDKPLSCPVLTLSLPEKIEASSGPSSATVLATYPGQCQQNNMTYLWSNGDTTATIADLSPGTYTVTVTTLCGSSASASVIISEGQVPDANSPAIHSISDAAVRSLYETGREAAINSGNTSATQNKLYKTASDNSVKEASVSQMRVNLYPNPAKHHITFDLSADPGTTSTIRIFDILGNEVIAPATYVSQKVEVSLDELPSGVYLYELSANKTFRGKFVKQ